MIASTGPKISSCATRMSGDTRSSSVGWKKNPPPEIRTGRPRAARGHVRAFTLADLHVAFDHLELLLRDDRPHVGIADARARRASTAARSVSRATSSSWAFRWTSSREPAEHVWPAFWKIALATPCDGEIEIGVGEDDVRRLAAELHHDRDDVVGGHLGDGDADRDRAGERELIDVGMTGQRGPGLRAHAGQRR